MLVKEYIEINKGYIFLLEFIIYSSSASSSSALLSSHEEEGSISRFSRKSRLSGSIGRGLENIASIYASDLLEKAYAEATRLDIPG